MSIPQTRPFLFKVEFAVDSYDFYVTDFEHFWSESLKRKDVIRRAFDIDTSIDPSEGSEQMKLFFHHLSNTLEGKLDTSISIENAPGNYVHLVATAKLPSQLPPLVWKFTPHASSHSSLADEILFPILQYVVLLKDRASSLIGQMKDKDRVISKLLNKLESSGIELTAVFPNVPLKGSKGSTKEATLKAVKGLRAFDENLWRDSNRSEEGPVSSLEDILDAALPFEGSSRRSVHLDDRQIPNHSTKVISEPAPDFPKVTIKEDKSVANDNLFQVRLPFLVRAS